MTTQCLQLRGEQDVLANPAKVEWFFSHPVPGQGQHILPPIPHCQREHSVAARQRRRKPPTRDCLNEDFGARMPAPVVFARGGQLAPDGRVVVDIVVERDLPAPIARCYWLGTSFAEVQDSQTTM